MSNDNKTLADVQPGGRVRLGDQPTIEKRARELLTSAYADTGAPALLVDEVRGGKHDTASDNAALRAIVTALSAQPSPGGQDALHEAARRVISDIDSGDYGGTISMATYDALAAALAARQPVGEPVLWVSPEVLDAMAIHRAQDFPAGGMGLACPAGSATVPLYLAPPAHSVDLVQEPMFYIQDTRQFVGNCPVWWAPNGGGYVTRLDEAGRYTEQEAVKKNRTRDTDIPWPCAEIDAIARPTVDFQHMRPRAERLAELALIDSQAVGNG